MENYIIITDRGEEYFKYKDNSFDLTCVKRGSYSKKEILQILLDLDVDNDNLRRMKKKELILEIFTRVEIILNRPLQLEFKKPRKHKKTLLFSDFVKYENVKITKDGFILIYGKTYAVKLVPV